jgi:autotransporter-associated beta strand protein
VRVDKQSLRRTMRRRPRFEPLEERLALATLGMGDGHLFVILDANEAAMVGGASMNGSDDTPLYFQSTSGSSITLSGDAANYFELGGTNNSIATVKSGQTLDTDTILAYASSSATATFTFGDGTNTLPDFGAEIRISQLGQEISQVIFRSNVTTTGGSQTYLCAAVIDGDVTLEGAGVSFESTINGNDATANDRLTIDSSAALSLSGTIGQTYALNALSLTSGSGDVSLAATKIDGTDAELTVHGAGTLTQTGVLSGAMDLTLESGTVTLDQTNTFTGDITVDAGTLVLGQAASASRTGSLIVGDGTGNAASATVTYGSASQLASTATVTVYADGKLDLQDYDQSVAGLTMTGGTVTGDSGTLTLGGNVTSNACGSSATIEGHLSLGGTTRTFTVADGNATSDLLISAVVSNGTLLKTVAGTLELSGANTYAGVTTVAAGTLLMSNNAALGTTDGNTVVNSGATLALSGVTTGEDVELDSSSSLLFTSSASTLNGDVLLSGDGAITVEQPGTINGVISDGVAGDGYALAVSANGIAMYTCLTLGGANTYRGGTVLNSGTTLYVSADSNLGAVPSAVDADNLQINGATLAATGSFTLNANRGIVIGASGLVVNLASDVTLTYNGNLTTSDDGSLEKKGLGTLVLGGTNQQASTTLTRGTLSVSSDASLGAVPTTATTRNIIFYGGALRATGTFAINANRGITAEWSDSTGNYVLTASGVTLTYAGVMAGYGPLHFDGAGTVVLTGNNTCTGSVTLLGGTLEVDGTLTSCTLAVSGGTLTGSGTVGTVTATTGTVGPQAALGTLSGTGLTVTSDTTFSFGLDGESGEFPTDGLLDLSGTLALENATLVLDVDTSCEVGETLVLVTADGGLSGVFSNASDGSTVEASNGQSFTIHITETQVTAVAGAVPKGATATGTYDPVTSTFYLRNTNTIGEANTKFAFGVANAGWIAITGDWNGDGIDTVGVYDPTTSTFYLRNSNTSGVADVSFAYGVAGGGWTPVAGDWNGDGVDTVGLYSPTTAGWYLRNSNTTGMADLAFLYGVANIANWTPVVGDWNGDGIDTVGFYDAIYASWILRNSNSSGVGDLAFGYGYPGAIGEYQALPIAGDWDGDGTATIGYCWYQRERTQIMYLRNSNTSGYADIQFGFYELYGNNSIQAISGAWTARVSAAAVDQLDLAALADEALSGIS